MNFKDVEKNHSSEAMISYLSEGFSILKKL